jgi:AraC-like DNA-binding protein
LIYAGRVGIAHRHRHAAVLLALVTSGRVAIADATGTRVSMTAAVLPVGALHEMHGLIARCVLAFLDPASISGTRLRSRVAIAGDPASAHTWVRVAEPIAALGSSTETADPAALVAQALDALVGPTPASSAIDDHPALRATVAALPRMLDGPVRLGDLADQVGLSADRLGRLFAGRLGLSFPAYVRWLRLRTAILQVRDGATLTDAAHAAGFADSAHLTRVCREMFGMAPSALARRIHWSG